MYLKYLTKRALPPIISSFLRNHKFRNSVSINYSELFSCPLCETKFEHFTKLDDIIFKMWNKYQFVHSPFLFETLNILNYRCPICGSTDRTRLCALFLKKKLDRSGKKANKFKLLDIGPDIQLQRFLKKNKNILYRSLDLFLEDIDDKADITNMGIYGSSLFDIIICSHVLEHVHDDRKALLEIFRILKPGGFGIIMVPILLSIEHDIENENYCSEADRWKFYGQNDHVRLYSKNGFLERLRSTKFLVEQYGINYFGEKTYEVYGIHHQSILYVVRKISQM